MRLKIFTIFLVVMIFAAFLLSVPVMAADESAKTTDKPAPTKAADDYGLLVFEKKIDNGENSVLTVRWTHFLNKEDFLFVQRFAGCNEDNLPDPNDGLFSFGYGSKMVFDKTKINGALRADFLDAELISMRIEFPGSYGNWTWVSTRLRYDFNTGFDIYANPFYRIDCKDWKVGPELEFFWPEGNHGDLSVGGFFEYPVLGGTLHVATTFGDRDVFRVSWNGPLSF